MGLNAGILDRETLSIYIKKLFALKAGSITSLNTFPAQLFKTIGGPMTHYILRQMHFTVFHVGFVPISMKS